MAGRRTEVPTNPTPFEGIQFEFLPWVDFLPGEDWTDRLRQAIVRQTFLGEVLYDERFKAFAEPWCRELDAPVGATIRTLRAYATASGQLPAELLVGVDEWVEVRRPAEVGVDAQQELFDAATRAISELSYAAGSVLARMGGPLAEFVHGEMRIEYPWVSASLLRLLIVYIVAALANPDNPDAVVAGWEIQAPVDGDDRNKVEAVLRISAGTPKAEAEARAAAFLAALYPPRPRPATRARPIPKHGGKDLENDTRMFYQAEVLGQKRTAVAKDHGVSYQRVQQAIKRVGGLLEVYVPFPSPEEDAEIPRKVQRRVPRR